MQRIITIISTILTTMNLQAQHPTIAADVHSHIVTKEYMDYLRANHADMEDGYPLPDWSAEEHLRFMDDAGIAWSVLTMPSPQPFFEDAQEAAKIIRSVNDEAWRTREKYPDRFRFCAAVPLPDVNLAIEESRLCARHAESRRYQTGDQQPRAISRRPCARTADASAQ